ncbi:MAG TPA: GntR family transcriptional regulator [Planctomycetota bacterium]|nr:GntR family transcriptional regulator [Planctomycetota bacterium]
MSDQLFLSAGDPRPMYQQIIDQITTRILAGDWSPSQALPSIRELAASSGVSVITVKRAYEELERAGLIQTRQGKGSVVTERHDLARTALEAGLDQAFADAALHGERLGLDGTTLVARFEGFLGGLEAPRKPAAKNNGMNKSMSKRGSKT